LDFLLVIVKRCFLCWSKGNGGLKERFSNKLKDTVKQVATRDIEFKITRNNAKKLRVFWDVMPCSQVDVYNTAVNPRIHRT
jgi:hypothetical protein